MSDSISIDPAEAVLAVLGELKRQRTEGLRHLYLEDSTIEGLEMLLGKEKKETMDPGHPIPPKSQISKEIQKIQTAPLETSQAPQPRTEEPHVKPSLLPTNPKFLHPPTISLPQGSKEEQWKWLNKRVLECEVCNAELNEGAQVVFGEGSLESDIFLCGEAPGAEEERAGEPFVGPAGDLLNRIISAMGLSRDSVYIGNVVNFRPRHQNSYGNRPPTVEEINFCLPFLKAQLDIVQPKVIVALGKTATDGLLGADPKRRLGQMRGNWHQYEGVPMMVTYHPSYLLHNPSKSSKRKVWEDMLKVMEKLELPISEKQRSFFQ